MREKIVKEALSWIGTPYNHGKCLKGVGCDCATLIYGVMLACGLVTEEDLGYYSPDWFAHSKEEKYVFRLLRHAYKTVEGTSYAMLEALPGTVVLTRHSEISRLYNHGGIVIKWPFLVHAVEDGVAQVDATNHWMWNYRKVAVFDLVAKHEMESIT